MAHTKSTGSTRLGRDSRGRRLGIKRTEEQEVQTGNVLIRQRGTKWLPGHNTKLGKDDTIFSLINGIVKFSQVRKRNLSGKIRRVAQINVISSKQK